MRHDGVGTDPLLERERNPFCPAAREREDQRRAVFADEVRDDVVHRLPMRMSGERAKFGSGRNDREIEFAGSVVGAHNTDRSRRTLAVGSHLRTGQKRGERLDWIERRRQADAYRSRRSTPPHHSLQTFERDSEMRAAFIAGNGVKFINDDVTDCAKLFAEARRS